MRKPQKPGTIRLSRELRGAQTDMEGLLWWKLRELNARGYHFRRQVPLRGYFLDFAEHSARIAVELDGGQHGTDRAVMHYTIRDRIIQAEGYLVLRFLNEDIRRNLNRIVELIVHEADTRRPPPEALRASTSPQGGGDC
jgi:very-short-patch-repair endonuclease